MNNSSLPVTEQMDFLPIFLDIKNRNCVVVGGGEVAGRKAAMLLRSGACVTVVSPQLGMELREQLQQGRITYCAQTFHAENLSNAVLVIAATSDPIVNRQVSEAAGQLGIPVNVVDNPALCSFIMPSILDRAPILVAISSGGASPVLTRLLRSRLETMIPSAYGRLAAYAADFRERVKSRFLHPEKRRRFWESVLQGPFAEMVFAGKDRAAKAYLERLLENEADDTGQQEGSREVSEEAKGEVYLVGAGPGDPELLTFRAMRLMQQADVVVYDRLVSPEILDMVRRDAPRIYAGKERSKHTMPQETINELLVRLAKEGKRVLRLKGGDPFIFGRGGEEIETLSGEGIPFQVVPGITAATGAASYAGIPLTHRDYAQSCVFVTGHLKDGSVDLDWPMLARPHQTIVIYMGLLGLSVLCRQLIEHGLPAATPAAIVQQGTTQKQRVLTGSLATLPDLTASAKLIPPTLIIVGDVVKLHQRLAWFEPESDLHANEPVQDVGPQ